MAKKHKFQRQIDRWLENADGDRDVLVDEITAYLEDGDTADYAEIADFVADELLGQQDDED
ncbi:hypothetical protein J2X72_003017 [Phyllobacterium sp. 1468]|uniref:hypothetical protein n=1 Tax=Phyllobacterium sp. 1468 TaxID=2817759 RepID=UPI00285A0E41|nr:hypothetical protein [Phyllobacterium sp. 1468]MDR6634217.1 hypothetical protein [Phyllobacterium sp. 1468]